MNTIHFLLDTKAKREDAFCLVLFLLVAVELLMNAIFLFRITQIGQLEDLYQLIPLAKNSMIGRVVVSIFQMATYDTRSIFFAILTSVSLRFFVILWMNGSLVGKTVRGKLIGRCKRLLQMMTVLLVLDLIGSILFVVVSITDTSYQVVLNQVIGLSYFNLVVIGICFILAVVGVIVVLYEYLDALQYDAIEV